MSPTKRQINDCLRKICKQINNDIDYINWGGCGVFAIALADIVNKLRYNDFIFRVYAPDDETYRPDLCILEDGLVTLPKSIDPWNNMNVFFNHIRMEWNGHVWDCDGPVSTRTNAFRTYYSTNDMYPGHLSYAAIAALLGRASNWNSVFDRMQIPKMKQIMYDIVHMNLGVKL